MLDTGEEAVFEIIVVAPGVERVFGLESGIEICLNICFGILADIGELDIEFVCEIGD